MNERSDYNAFIERLKKSDDEFRAESTQKRHANNFRTARENLNHLVDQDTFLEFGQFAVAAQRSRRDSDELILDTNAALGADTNNVTGASSTLITVGNGANCNQNTSSHVAYLFAEKQGFSKFGSYLGNGNANGTFVYTGFKPSFVMIKRTDSLANWVILDNKRDAYNQATEALRPDLPNVTLDSTDHATDFLSNGFKLGVSDTKYNGNDSTYIYLAFAESPFVSSKGVPTTAR